ncbi:hypothetical protein [Ferrimonas gelatinilytica]|uniref:DUF4124 domain-containing protein n=1 Tax=Ferrimonas gelatinilytica TaxID=1255257 RepID=A0ABP9SBT8_9GAMM
MKTGVLMGLLLISSAQAAEQLSYHCTHDGAVREIAVVYPEGTPLPCEVRYSNREGMTTLWQAQNSEGYCEQQAEAFVAQQRSWGWHCERQHGELTETQTGD